MKTTDYDDSHSQAFYDRTINADIGDIYERFLNYLPEKDTLLDAGCGVGRDVSAFEASQKW